MFWVAEHEPYKENTEAEIEPHRSSAAPAGTSCGESSQSSGSFEKKSCGILSAAATKLAQVSPLGIDGHHQRGHFF